MSRLKDLTEQIRLKKEKVLQMGGGDKIAQQKAMGKLTVRERLDLLFDEDSFVETGILGHHQDIAPDMKGKYTPADGCVTGFGKIEGRLVCVAAYDFTVMAGSIGFVQETKVARMREMALKERIPMIWLLDSAGARIQEIAGGYQIVTDQQLAPWVKRALQSPKPDAVSAAALETLAIIAYRQPVTKAEVEAVRGVDVTASLDTLVERRFVRIAGRKDSPGRPFLYGTTAEFLRHFGLKSLEALPPMALPSIQEPVAAPAESAGPQEPASPAEPGASQAASVGFHEQ